MLGTNPLSLAIPAGKHEPYVLDMATSVVARGKVVLAQKEGRSIPGDWGVDKYGVPSTDPAAILDGGASKVGVESTVVDMTGEYPQVLRPGAVTEEMIAAVMGRASTDVAVTRSLEAGEQPKAPGMKYRHYAPKAPVQLFEGAPEDSFAALAQEAGQAYDGILCFEEYYPALKAEHTCRVYSLGYSWDHQTHARRLFALLRKFDGTKAKRILAQCPRAYGANAATVNRLRKAAGFAAQHCTDKTVIGLTGPSGSGKSTLSGMLQANGALVLDADAIYHRLTDEPWLQEKLENRFPGVVQNGVLDRKKLGAIVFADEQARRDLNAITHGAVRAELQRQTRAYAGNLVVLDVPLLFESGIDRDCTLTIGITAPRELCLQRICARDGIGESYAKARLDAQPKDSFYAAHCDAVVQNMGDLDTFRLQLERLLGRYGVL
jgi:L-threonylcarbamoyladenylate synthase